MSGWRITRRRMLVIIVVLFLALVAANLIGCRQLTRAEEDAIKRGAGVATGMVGLPPYVGESIAGLVLSVSTYIAGHKRGRRKERVCQARPPTTKAASP